MYTSEREAYFIPFRYMKNKGERYEIIKQECQNSKYRYLKLFTRILNLLFDVLMVVLCMFVCLEIHQKWMIGQSKEYEESRKRKVLCKYLKDNQDLKG